MTVRELCFMSLFLALKVIASGSSPIPVANFSFETLPSGGLPLSTAGGGAYSLGPIPGWTNSGMSGQLQPGSDTAYFNYIPDGITAGRGDGGGEYHVHAAGGSRVSQGR